jgi:hypothetical protein
VQLEKRVQASNLETVADLYDHDPEFAAIADHCLKLCKIDPDWLTIDMLAQFLLPYQDEQGNAQPGLLQALNFPVVPDSGGKGGSYAEAIAAVWTHTQDLQAALKAVGLEPDEQLAWNELQEVLEAHGRFSDPNAAEKAEEAEALEAIAEELKAKPESMGFDGVRFASDAETAAILAGI